jgi:hypothetical protein
MLLSHLAETNLELFTREPLAAAGLQLGYTGRGANINVTFASMPVVA